MALTFDTVANVVSDAAVECGLGPVSDVFGSSDGNIVQMRGLLKSLGRQLWREREWTYLQKEAIITTVQGTADYALPVDFGAMIQQTGWNRTNRLPLGGPTSPQEWQYLVGRVAASTISVVFRPKNRRLYLYPNTNTAGGMTLAFEYISTWWVQSSGATAGDKDAPTANTDTLLFDPLLLVKGLRYQFLAVKGLDATAALADFNAALEAAKCDDSPMPVLRMGRPKTLDPLLGSHNVPITGYDTR